ncbi:Gfo/Idh/MocA family protein [Schumannella luteola]
MSRRVVNIGIVGGGLMGREVAGAIQRWPTLVDHPVDARLVAVADIEPRALAWFEGIGTVRSLYDDYRALLADPEVDVVYMAVRHDLHEQFYIDAVRAGKALLAEKPFGIDLAAARRIVDVIDDTPDAFVRCSSEIPFYPGAQWVISAVRSGALGRLFSVRAAMLHSSDLDLEKPINWKRQARFNGAAGALNDLGMHALHIPLRLGWEPTTVFGLLQDIVHERRGPDGLEPVDTFENAELLGRVAAEEGDFSLRVETKRVSLGDKNTWSLEVQGLDGGVRYSTKNPKSVEFFSRADLPGVGGEQVWQQADTGSVSVWPTVTGPLFEFGFADSILQMWSAFLAEYVGELGDRFGCATPQEALAAHRITAAALESHQSGRAVAPPA